MAGQIVKYKIIQAKYSSWLANDVNVMIKQGWVPQGGVAIMVWEHTGEPRYYQAMVKYEPEREDQSAEAQGEEGRACVVEQSSRAA